MDRLMGDLSPHFSRHEFRCRHCGRVGPEDRLRELVVALERLRELVGRPLKIVSGYRCIEHNRNVNGATHSRHVAGDAADLPSGYATVRQAELAGFHGIGRRGAWAVHVDRRGNRARWRY